MPTFKDKNVLITGGANGIGFLMGKQLLDQHIHKLIIWDVDSQSLTTAIDRLQSYKNKISTYTVNVSNPEQVYQAARKVLDDYPKLDLLINNAGIVTGKMFHKQSREEIERTIRVNLLGAMHTTRAFLPRMINQGSGHIVNIASAAGLMANPKMCVYAGSKWGLTGWSDSLRVELEQQESGINVTTVQPSYINTGMFEGVKPPMLTPVLNAEEISSRIINAIEKKKIHLREPFMVKLLPFLKGVLPTRIFDFLAGKLFRVYHSMDSFENRSGEKTF